MNKYNMGKHVQSLGDNIWYDNDTGIFYKYDTGRQIYIEIDTDNPDM